jgi:type IV secretory pathway TraG/TraD family ATPase VirD4
VQSLLHGWPEFFIAYALTAVGLWLGGGRPRLEPRRILSLAAFALPTMLGAALAWALIHELASGFFRRLPGSVTVLLGMVFVPAFAMVGGALLVRSRLADTHKRGTVLLDQESSRKRPSARTDLTLAGQGVFPIDETKHFKFIGTTGTGKSTAIRELLTGALSRGDRAVIADPDGSYLRRFYDPARGDRILNPFDERSARWDLFAEIIQLHDADQLARSLIPDYEGADRSWRHYARTFVTAILRQLHRVDEHDLTKLYYLLLMASSDELRELLEPTPAGPFLGQDNGKFFESVRSITNVHVAALEHLARQSEGEMLSVRKWIRAGRGAPTGGVLFLPYRASEIAALRHIVSTWMRLAIFEAMNASEGDQRLWFIVDELDALGAIDGLKDALARLRKFGGRCVLGFQSIAQVRGTYGDTEAQTIVENCGNTLILRCSASERGGTAEFASRLIGRREIVRHQVSYSRPTRFGGLAQQTSTSSDQHVTEDAVMASEIEQLPDLTGFLKLASRPEWRPVELSPP